MRVLSLVLALVMVIGALPFQAVAAVSYDERTDDYYNVVSKTDYELAPGITESEIVLNNDAGTHRQVAHVVEVDIHNPYTKVMPSYNGMAEALENKDYSVEVMSKQVAYAEEHGYGNVVAAMNLSLSWYNSTYYSERPELVGEPLGYLVMDGVYYENSQGKTSGAQTCLVINFDEKDGVARPAELPKTEIRSTSSAITGWEEQVIPANFGFLVKDGVNQYKKDHSTDAASRSFVGIKADGSVVMVMNDGRQAPYSVGFNSYEMAEFMLSLGCVQAVNGDGGGSSAFLSQRPGEELKLNCTPSDGGERSTTHGILVISTAPATGEFVRAQITTGDKFYTPGSAVQFEALGTDLVGTPAEVPADALWQLTDNSFGTIDNTGLFVSNGKTGAVTAQLVYNGQVAGEASIEIVLPDVSFKQDPMVLPYGESVEIAMNVTTNGGLNNVATKEGDIVFSLSDPAMGTIEGSIFTTTTDTAVTGGTLTAVVCGDTEHPLTATVKFGKASEVVYDYEDGQFPIDEDPEVDPPEGEPYGWFIRDSRANNYFGYRNWASGKNTPIGMDIPAKVYLTDADSGMVRNGNYAMGIDIDWTNVTASCHGQVDVFFPENIDLTDATRAGFWMYIPAELVTASMQVRAGFQTLEGKSTAVTQNIVDMMGPNSGVENGGWFYFSWDVMDYKAFEYFEINSHYTAGAGNYNYYQNVTFYVDDITVDYSDATIDRENPYFTGMGIVNFDESVEVSGQTVTTNTVTLTAQAHENTEKLNATGLDHDSVKVYVDGVLRGENVTVSAGGVINVPDLYLNDGVHTIVMEISDLQGNTGNIVRKLTVNTDQIDVRLETPASRFALLPTGSLYWVNLVADRLAEVESLTVTVNLDYVNAWELEGMEVAYGFEAEYYINHHNDAVITFTRVDEEIADTNVLAKLPIRIWMAKGWMDDSGIRKDYISDDPAKQDKYWILTPHAMWYSDGTRDYRLVVGAEAGVVTYVDGSTMTFSAAETVIQTEMNRYYTNSDRQGKWSFHICTPGTAESKAATCLESGYENRVFCVACACGTVEHLGTECDTHNGCGGVMEWGTYLPATGHDYQLVDGVLKCVNSCGEVFTGVLDGKTYFDGILAEGWIDGTYYYVDGVMVTGQYYMDGVLYTFGEDGVYDPDYMYTGFYSTVDGKLMYFVANKFLSGYQYLMGEPYTFDANGYGYEGEYIMAGERCLFDDGQFVSCSTAKLIDAGVAGDKVTYALYTDGTFKLDGTGTTYSFNNHGTRPFAGYAYKIKTLKIGEGITRIGSYFMCYSSVANIEFAENSSLQQIGTAAFLGDYALREITLPASVTYVSNMAFGRCTYLNKLVMTEKVTTIHSNAFKESANVTLYVIDGSYAMEYAIAKNIPYVIYQPEIKREIVEIDGALYYYEDGVKTYGGLIYLDGFYYYVRSNGQLVVDRTYWVTKTNDLLPAGNYTFGADGKMLNAPEAPAPDVPGTPEPDPEVGSIVDVGGVLYFYKDGKPFYAGLILLGGDYYYVRSNGQLVVGRSYWVTKTNDLLPQGDYTFGADGKMVDAPETPAPDAGSIVEVGGELYFYKDGKPFYAGLVRIGADYYYARSNGQLVVGRSYWITKTNDLLPAGNYTFGADGKMIIE